MLKKDLCSLPVIVATGHSVTSGTAVSESCGGCNPGTLLPPAGLPAFVSIAIIQGFVWPGRSRRANGCIPRLSHVLMLAGKRCDMHFDHSELCVQVLNTADADGKAALAHAVWRRFAGTGLDVGSAEPPDRPARPAKPEVATTASDVFQTTLLRATLA